MNNDQSEVHARREQADNQATEWDGDPHILDVAYHALYCPCAVAGKYQWDHLMCVILYIKAMAEEEQGGEKLSFLKFITVFSKEFEDDRQEDRPSVIFQAFAERLTYLESYQPTDRDFAVDALQDAFCRLMHSRYEWGKKRSSNQG